jgi:hypothetical protein
MHDPDKSSTSPSVSNVSNAAGVAGRDARRPRRGAVDFVDREGVFWRVIERDARGDPGTRGDWCLVFFNEEVARRVWRYPPGWRMLSDTELDALGRQPPGQLYLVP